MTFNAGLNRVTLVDVSGLPGTHAGTVAHQWLATWGIAARMRRQMDTAGLPAIPRLPGVGKLRACSAYPVALDARLTAGDEGAQQFADQMGAALAALVLTLKRAPDEARAARPEWPETHWQAWTGVRHIVLGGGVLDGALGRHLHATASRWLGELGAGVTLTLPAKPRHLMLAGLGRAFTDGPVVALDAGHTAIKRGVVSMRAGEVTEIGDQEPLPVPYHLMGAEHPLDIALRSVQDRLNPGARRERAEALLNVLLGALVQLAAADHTPTQFGLSLSVPLDDAGNVATGAHTTSLYRHLSGIDLPHELERRLSARLRRPVWVVVRHEGQAAAQAVPGANAAILLGTSVGGGLRVGGP